MKRSLLVFATLMIAGALNAQTIYSNGSYYNSTGTGSAGANESILQTTTFSMGTIGFGQQSNSFNRIADDFTIADCRWRIDSIALYGYQTGSTTTSTFTSYNLRIWDGVPDNGSSAVVFGDTTTNRLIRSEWSGAYRVTETTSGNTQRPIMRNVINIGGLELNSGSYWLDWSATGSLASGPWQPPVAILGQPITGNGLQRIGSTWNNLIDGGTGTPQQGAPFIIYGTIYNATADAGSDQAVCEQIVISVGNVPSGTGTGSLTYQWTANLPLSDTAVANPTVTITDTLQAVLQVTDSIGCVATDTLIISALPLPTVSIDTLGSWEFCEGNSVQLTTDNTGGLVWSTTETTDTITVSSGNTYSVVFTDFNGCTAFDTVAIQVNPLPAVDAGSNIAVCYGTDVTVAGAGALSYSWDNGISDNTPFTAISNAVLVVTGTDANGCTNIDSLMLTVYDLPVVNGGNDPISCAGQTITFEGAGAVTYDWSNGAVDGVPFAVNASGWVVVTGTDIQGCTDTDSVYVTVNETTDTTIVVSALDSYTLNGQTYTSSGTYQQTETNAVGCDSLITIELTLDFTGINELSMSAVIYPNPATNQLFIQTTGMLNGQFQVLDLSGRQVAEGEIKNAFGELAVGHLQPGQYLIRFSESSLVSTFIKN